MFRIMRSHRGLLIITLSAIVLVSLFEIGKAELTSQVLNSVIDGPRSFLQWGGLFLGFIVCFCVISFIQKKLVIQVKAVSWKTMNTNLIRYYMQMDPGQFSRQSDVSTLINEFNTKIGKIVNMYESAWLNLFYFGTGFILGSIYIGIEQIGILLFIYGATLLALFWNSRFAGKMKEKQIACIESEKQWTGMIKSLAQTFRTIKNYNDESRMEQRLDEKNQKLTASWNHFESFLKLLSACNDLFTQTVYFGILLIGVWMISQGRSTIGQLIGIVQACNLVTTGMMNFSELYNQMQSSRFLLKEYLEKTENQSIKKQEGPSSPESFHQIEVRDLTFSYDGKKNVLEHIDLQIQKGKKYLIVGLSGQGKTTLIDLLLKNRETDRILLDGRPISKLPYSSYIRRFACVYQNEPLLAGTLRENLVLSSPVNEDELTEALHAFHLDDLIGRLDLSLKEDMPELSGGQCQRIHLLRALLSGRDILVLDEAFSALDQETAKEIERMLLHDEERTILSVSHKIIAENIDLYDAVIEIRNGRLLIHDPVRYKKAATFSLQHA